ncbi:MAG: T9SS type A sorting domain-containing protein, partial [bacterium]
PTLDNLATPGETRAAAFSGNHAYVADNHSGLHVIDVADPAAMEIVGSLAIADVTRGIAVEGGLAYTGDNFGLRVIDVVDPTTPALVAGVALPGQSFEIALRDGRAFVAAGQAGLAVVDVTDPEVPVMVGGYPSTGDTEWVRLRESVLFMNDDEAGLLALDVQDPANPALLGVLTNPAGGFALVGDLVYLVSGEKLLVVDASDPASMWVIAGCKLRPGRHGVAVAGDRAYVSGSSLMVVDIGDPTNPTYIGSAETLSVLSLSPAVHNGALFVCDFYRGFTSLPLECRATDTHVSVVASSGLQLAAPHPNPSRSTTGLTFSLPATAQTVLTVHDVSGRRVCTLVDGDLPAGSHRSLWEGRDEYGRTAAAGVYFARLESRGQVRTTKIVRHR